MEKPIWLDHLSGAVPDVGYGNRMSMYLIALEAWRRGLKVKFYKLENPQNKMFIRYTISDGLIEHKFESSLGDKVTDSAFKICENKDHTKKVLLDKNIPVPEGQRFHPNTQLTDIIAYVKKLQYPVVVKPISENAGNGVFTNIMTEEALVDIVNHVRNDLDYQDIIVEKHFEGTEYRILVIDGQIIGAVNRRPANIKGDGVSTDSELIKDKNDSKKQNPILSSKGIEIDKEVVQNLEMKGLTLETVLPKHQELNLRNKSNVSRGGDPIDVTDQLTDEMKDIALEATQAIEGLGISGLDMLVNEETKTCVVLEINTKPMIGLHMYPIIGQARDISSPIIDYYFPKTKHTKKSNLFFDFDAALSPIRNYLTNELTLAPIKNPEPLKSKQFLIKGEELTPSFRSVVRHKALELSLHGQMKEIKNNKQISIVVADSVVDNLVKFSTYIKKISVTYSISSVKELEWDRPIPLGFKSLTIPNELTNIRRLEKSVKRQRQKIYQLEEKALKHEQTKKDLENKIKDTNRTIIRQDRERQLLHQNNENLSCKLNERFHNRSSRMRRSSNKNV